MNKKQKYTLIVVAVIIVIMLLFPPFDGLHIDGRPVSGSVSIGYHWLFDTPRRGTLHGFVNVATLLAQWLCILIVGGIAFFLFKDNEK